MVQSYLVPIGKEKVGETTPYCNTGTVDCDLGVEIQVSHDWVTLGIHESKITCSPEEFAVKLMCHLARKRIIAKGSGWNFKTPEESRAMHGYENASVLTFGGTTYARMDWGGKNQRGWMRLDISGKMCHLLTRVIWLGLFRSACKYAFRLNRVDAAVDDLSGSVFDVFGIDEDFRRDRRAFLPVHRSSGIEPDRGWEDKDNGVTLYINRDSSIGHCIYQKGLQMSKVLRRSEGFRNPRWVRWEVRFRRKRQDLELEPQLLHPDYLAEAAAGSCKYLANLIKRKGAKFTMWHHKPKEESQETAAKAILWLLTQGGGVIGHLWRLFGPVEALKLISRRDEDSPLANLQRSDIPAILERLQVLQASSEATAAEPAVPGVDE